MLLQVLLWIISFAVGKPLIKKGCTLTSEIELFDPTDTGAEIECKKCPECPEGQGLTPRWGSKVPNHTEIECIQCQENVSYSNSHGIIGCKACQDCGLKNVIPHCSPFPVIVTSFSNIHYNNIIVSVRDFLMSKRKAYLLRIIFIFYI